MHVIKFLLYNIEHREGERERVLNINSCIGLTIYLYTYFGVIHNCIYIYIIRTETETERVLRTKGADGSG